MGPGYLGVGNFCVNPRFHPTGLGCNMGLTWNIISPSESTKQPFQGKTQSADTTSSKVFVRGYLYIFGYSVSTRLDAHLTSAHIPLFGLKVIIKYDVIQCDFCLGISPIPLFHLDVAGNALRAYMCGYSMLENRTSCMCSFY